MPFDAMKGLKEALRKQEEKRLLAEKRELTEESIEHITKVLGKTAKGNRAEILHYRDGHEVRTCGKVSAIDYAYKYITVDSVKIYFDDIYEINTIADDDILNGGN